MVCVTYKKENGEWEQIEAEEKTSDDLYLDGGLKRKLDNAKQRIKKDFDVGGIICGGEGTGKSTLASNIMIYMTDCKFDPTRDIIKSHEDAIRTLRDVPDGSGVMFDEGYLLFYSADTMTKKQKEITKIFSIIRQKNLFFLIVAPSFFRLSSYFALDRTKFCIRVYDKNSERGYFEWWGGKRKEKLYKFGKPKLSYKMVSPSMRGRFTKCTLLDDKYAKLKRETLEEAFKETEVQKSLKQRQNEASVLEFRNNFLERNKHLTDKQMGELLGVARTTIIKYRKKHELLKQELDKRMEVAVHNVMEA